MSLISDKNLHTLGKMNQVLIQKWNALVHARQKGNDGEILAAEMQYLSALQNLNSVAQGAVSPASTGGRKNRDK